jgi:hypothetical protein
MDSGAAEFSQLGLPTPYPYAFTNAHSEEPPAEHVSAVQSFTPQQQGARSANGYSNSATPTSEYGVYPASARSSNFPENVRQYPGTNGAMAQQPPSPSSIQDGQNHQNSHIKSDQDVPIDPSIAASSPTYPAHGQYSPYPPQQDMQHGYPGHPSGAMYQQPRPDWAGYAGQPQHGMPAYTGVHTPTSAASAGPRPGQVGQVYQYPTSFSVISAPTRHVLVEYIRRVVPRTTLCSPQSVLILRSHSPSNYTVIPVGLNYKLPLSHAT